jgi:hypothetical protein
MTRLKSQRHTLIATINSALTTFRHLAAASSGKAKEHLDGLYGTWVIQKLTAALSAIEAVDVEQVRAVRYAKQSTYAVFESHIDAARSALRGQYGVTDSISELFKHTADYSANQIHQLGRVLRLTQVARRRLRVFRSRSLSLVTSGPFWVLLFMLAILTIPIVRYGSVYWQTPKASASSIDAAIARRVRMDADSVRSQASAPDKPLIERTASTVKAIWELIDTVPKIVSALVAAWGMILLWLRR